MNTYGYLPVLGIGLLLVACGGKDGDEGGSGAGGKAGRGDRQELAGRQRDLRQSLAEAKGLKTAVDRDRALIQVARDAMGMNPGLVAEALRHMSAENPERVALLKEMVALMAKEDATSALSWASTLDGEHDRAVAKAEVALHVSSTDPAAAAKILADSGVTGADFDAVAVPVFQNWAAQVPQDAAEWVLKYPAGNQRETAVKAVMGRWVQGDAAAAFAWMTSQSNPSVREETTRTMANVLINNPDPIRETILAQAEPEVRGDLESRMHEIVEGSRDPSEPQPEPEEGTDGAAAPEHPQPGTEPAPAVAEPQPEAAPQPDPADGQENAPAEETEDSEGGEEGEGGDSENSESGGEMQEEEEGEGAPEE